MANFVPLVRARAGLAGRHLRKPPCQARIRSVRALVTSKPVANIAKVPSRRVKFFQIFRRAFCVYSVGCKQSKPNSAPS